MIFEGTFLISRGGLWDDCSDQITNRSEALQGTYSIEHLWKLRSWDVLDPCKRTDLGPRGGREREYPSFEAPVGSRNELAAAQMLVQRLDVLDRDGDCLHDYVWGTMHEV